MLVFWNILPLFHSERRQRMKKRSRNQHATSDQGWNRTLAAFLSVQQNSLHSVHLRGQNEVILEKSTLITYERFSKKICLHFR